jgi:TP901-1 family phage major tail protein
MATKYAGRSFLVKSGDGGGTEVFTTIGNMRTNSLSINNEMIDVTDKDGGQFREIIAGGIKSLSISGEGVMSDDTIVARLLAKSLSTTGTDKSNYQIVIGTGTFTGSFFLTKFEVAGGYNDAQTYTIALESAGSVSFA